MALRITCGANSTLLPKGVQISCEPSTCHAPANITNAAPSGACAEGSSIQEGPAREVSQHATQKKRWEVPKQA
eukprot:4059229-Amphidinium_carterae.1